jgi:hypothetical protein
MKKSTFFATVAAAALVAAGAAHAEGCTSNHELYKIVPKYRAIMLDGGKIVRAMYVDSKDERLSTWKPGHNITFCPGDNKMVNTTIKSVATLLSETLTPCKPLWISDEMDSALKTAWEYAKADVDSRAFLAEAKSKLGWYYRVCTDHDSDSIEKGDLKDLLISAASLSRVNMSVDDPANAATYKARAEKYEQWRDALYKSEDEKSWTTHVWKWFSDR